MKYRYLDKVTYYVFYFDTPKDSKHNSVAIEYALYTLIISSFYTDRQSPPVMRMEKLYMLWNTVCHPLMQWLAQDFPFTILFLTWQRYVVK